MVRAVQIAKHFSDPKRGLVRAVDGVDFEAHPGQITGLLGANGAGKTTLLRMLSTIAKPTSGSAEVEGVDVVQEPEKVRSMIGFMSASTALYGRLRAKELIEYFGRLYGLEGARLETRWQFVKQQLNLSEFEDRLCDKLSTGQKQRVSIARTILHDPPVLFFDEPTAGLDVLVSQSVMEFIEGAKQDGKTVVFSTHIMSEVERLCDKVVVIHDGKALYTGPVSDLKEGQGEANLEKAFLKLVGHQSGMSA
jgi:sodium transport system ATP-binding protein